MSKLPGLDCIHLFDHNHHDTEYCLSPLKLLHASLWLIPPLSFAFSRISYKQTYKYIHSSSVSGYCFYSAKMLLKYMLQYGSIVSSFLLLSGNSCRAITQFVLSGLGLLLFSFQLFIIILNHFVDIWFYFSCINTQG